VGTAQTAQFRAMGIISGAAGHPKDVPFVREFGWGTYGLAAISSRKTQILAIVAINCTVYVNNMISCGSAASM